MILKIVISSLLALSAANAVAGNTTYLSAAELKILNAELDAEVQALKEEYRVLANEGAKLNLKSFQKQRKEKKGVLGSNESEEIYRIGNSFDSNIDVGAKIGMTTDQVLSKTYWGKPDHTHEVMDEYGKLESWIYEHDRGSYSLYFDNGKLIRIFK